ncbi:uncharacterized protein LOC144095248 [Amblyomma americanum]
MTAIKEHVPTTEEEAGSSGGGGGGGGGGSTVVVSTGSGPRRAVLSTTINSTGTTGLLVPSIGPLIPMHMTPPQTAVPTLGTTTTTRRSGMVMCVVGESFVDPKVFDGGWCDYAIYPDLFKYGNSFLPIYGETSWDAFKAAVGAHQQMGVGVSFSLLHPRNNRSTVGTIPRTLVLLERLVREMNVSAMGVLNFPRHEGMNTTELAPVFEELKKAVIQQEHSEPVVFLGVQFYTAQAVDDFVSEVGAIGSLTTIIIQTHIHSVGFFGPQTLPGCHSFPVSLKNAHTLLPSFAFAERAAQRLRSQSDKFRIMFSSTLGVALFVGEVGSGKPRTFLDKCDRAVMADYGILCNSAGSYNFPTSDHREEFGYTSWVDNYNRTYWASYETERSLTLKLERHARNSSDGWVVFEVQHDVSKACNVNNYLRLELIQAKARRSGP